MWIAIVIIVIGSLSNLFNIKEIFMGRVDDILKKHPNWNQKVYSLQNINRLITVLLVVDRYIYDYR